MFPSHQATQQLQIFCSVFTLIPKTECYYLLPAKYSILHAINLEWKYVTLLFHLWKKKIRTCLKRVWKICSYTEHSFLRLFQKEVHILWYGKVEIVLNLVFASFSTSISYHICLLFMTAPASWPSHALFWTPGMFLLSHLSQLPSLC